MNKRGWAVLGVLVVINILALVFIWSNYFTGNTEAEQDLIDFVYERWG